MPSAEDEVVELCRDLIRIESVNDGTGRGPGERAAAEYVAEKLSEFGLQPEIFESAPGRASVVARMVGQDSSRDALLIHGHLDVVPAQPKEWTYDPFAAEVAEGTVRDLHAKIGELAVAKDFLLRKLKPWTGK